MDNPFLEGEINFGVIVEPFDFESGFFDDLSLDVSYFDDVDRCLVCNVQNFLVFGLTGHYAVG